MKYNIIIMMIIVILCYPLLLAKVKEYAVTIAIHMQLQLSLLLLRPLMLKEL